MNKLIRIFKIPFKKPNINYNIKPFDPKTTGVYNAYTTTNYLVIECEFKNKHTMRGIKYKQIIKVLGLDEDNLDTDNYKCFDRTK